MNKYEFIDESDFWNIKRNGHQISVTECINDISALQAELDAANAHIVELNKMMHRFSSDEFEYYPGCEDIGEAVDELLARTKAQSLASVQAAAVMRFGKFVTGSDFALEWERLTIQDMALIVDSYANKIMEGTK